MSKLGGYTGKILKIDLSNREVKTLQLDKELAAQFLGGRGFNSKRLYDMVSPGLDPLSPENPLLIATGPLVGTMFPTASRFNISAKSPLTGILGDTNAGGHFASEMKFAGYDQIIIVGKSNSPIYIYINDDQVEFRDASHISGKDVYEADSIIKADVGDKQTQTLIAGPAAENGVKFSGLFANLMRAAARTGMGTVLASKGVKAIAIRGTGVIEVSDPYRFEKVVEEIEEEIYNHEQYWPRRKMGTTRILLMANEAGFLPTRHYTQGTFEYAEEVSGERLAEEFNVKTRGCFACPIPCSRFYVVKEGKFRGNYGEGPEFESQGSLTSRIGNRNLALALKGNDMCNKFGIDILTTSECISWAMELYSKGMLTKDETDGLDLTWGNEAAILTLIEKIANRDGFGDILADGPKAAAIKLGKGLDLTMQVKGLDLIMADPRGLKGFGLGYAVASRGGDHLRSEPFLELKNDPSIGQKMFGVPEATLRLADKGKGKLVSYFEDWNAVIDALEPCKNIMQNMEILTFERASEVIEVVTGMKLTATQVKEVGTRINTIERAFNVREGIRRKDDYLPRRFIEEELPNGASSGTVVNMDLMLNEYYTERGWNKDSGIPLEHTLLKLGLKKISEDMKKYS